MSIVLYILGGLTFIASIKFFFQGNIGSGIFGIIIAAAFVVLGIYLKKRKDKRKAAEAEARRKKNWANYQKQLDKEIKEYDEMFGKEDKPDEEEE